MVTETRYPIPMKPILTFLTLFTLSLVFFSCTPSGKADNGLVTIDVKVALKTEKEFRLSEMVESIEYVKLETRPECLVSNASRVIGKKYIVLLNSEPPQILLFDRTGKFIRPIGKVGKGPGEYTYPNHIDFSPDEERILVHDVRQRLFMEFSVDGNPVSTSEAPRITDQGPYYIDQEHIVYMEHPLFDTVNYAQVVAMNLLTGVKTPLRYNRFKRNSDPGAGYCFGNNFFRTDEGIVFKDALCDTIYQIDQDLSVKPLYYLNAFASKPEYYCMTETEIDAYSSVSLSCAIPGYLFLIGGNPERFHLVLDIGRNELFRLEAVTRCTGENEYKFGLINDLDGTKPFWFWGGNIRNKNTSNLLQIIDLKETIKTDCFLKADLKTNQYRDQLKKLVDESTENDNPIIRIMRLRN